MFALLLILIVIILIFLYLADSKLISYPTQSSLISDHIAILFYLNLPVIQINRPSRSFRKSSSNDKPMCDNSVFHQRNNKLNLLIFLHFLIILIWYYLIRLIFVYPTLLLSTELILSFPWSNIELVNLRQLLRRLQRKYASSKLKSDLISFKIVNRFKRKNVYQIVILH